MIFSWDVDEWIDIPWTNDETGYTFDSVFVNIGFHSCELSPSIICQPRFLRLEDYDWHLSTIRIACSWMNVVFVEPLYECGCTGIWRLRL